MLHCRRGVRVLILTDGNFHSWQSAKNPVWTLFFANRTFDKYQRYFRISVCILVQTFCKCQTACVICDIWHWDDLWCLKYFLATLVMFMLMSWPPPDTWHRFKNVFCKINATQCLDLPTCPVQEEKCTNIRLEPWSDSNIWTNLL